MTPKEAIKRLRSIGEKGMRESDYREVSDSLALYRQDLELVLHTPTVDEVCKALSEHEKRNVRYSEKTHEFYYLEYEGKIGEYQQFITETYGDGLWSLGVYLPPHLITMIGRFYEKESERE